MSAKPAFKAPLFLIVSIVAFGTGIVLVTAAQRTTENRSKASGLAGPYNCSVLCNPPAGNLANSSCQLCLSGGGTVTLVNGSNCSMDAPPESSVSCQNCPGDDFYINASGRPTCGIGPKVSPTPVVNPWDQCMSWNQQSPDLCVDTYRTYKEKRDADWRCKTAFAYLGLCEYPAVEFPSVPLE